MSIHYHWDDQPNWGKPSVGVLPDRRQVVFANAILDIEVRNTTNFPQRISDIYLETRSGDKKQLVGVSEPATIGRHREWYKRSNRRRVEWLLEPHSAGVRETINFSSDWDEAQRPRTTDDNQYELAIVIELEGGQKTIRLYLAEDIMGGPTQ
jgi:hypothetical protein